MRVPNFLSSDFLSSAISLRYRRISCWVRLPMAGALTTSTSQPISSRRALMFEPFGPTAAEGSSHSRITWLRAGSSQVLRTSASGGISRATASCTAFSSTNKSAWGLMTIRRLMVFAILTVRLSPEPLNAPGCLVTIEIEPASRSTS